MNRIFFIVTKESEATFSKYLSPSLKPINCECVAVSNEPGKIESTPKKYNLGLQALLGRGDIPDDGIFVFCNEDIKIVDNAFREKVEIIFNETDAALIGTAGTISLEENCDWRKSKAENIKGHYLLEVAGDRIGKHISTGEIGFFNEVVAIDNSIVITQAKYLKEGIRFDPNVSTDKDLADFMAADFALQFLKKGHRTAVADILIYKRTTPSDKLDNVKFRAKWDDLGFPITIDKFKLGDANNVMEIEI